MLKLDNKDGLIDIGNITISPKLSLSEIEVMSRKYKIIRTIVNEGYVSYSIPSDDNREFSLYLTFYQGKLYSLNIGLGSKYQYPPWQITDAEIAQRFRSRPVSRDVVCSV